MGDLILIGIRFVLYADLMLVTGLAAFLLYAPKPADGAQTSLAPAVWWAGRRLCVIGLLLSTIGMIVLAAAMQGVGIFELTPGPFRELVVQTDVGTAWRFRTIALLAALAASIWLTRWPVAAAMLITATSTVAIATLVWSGHAGATEGTAGMIHRISDILHMIAAAVWIGAIVAFFPLLSRARNSPDDLDLAARSLDRFSIVGTICVLVIAVTGIVNTQMIVGVQNIALSLAAPYGWLLLAKLALFALMLALAAANRWRLTPAVQGALSGVDPDQAIAALRRSLTLEVTAAMAILALVAWFGTLEPFVASDLP